MTELQSILSALDTPSVLATVVNVEGSAYRRPGARMLVRRDGRTVGTISGGCLEADVIERAWDLTASGQAALIRYDTRAEDTQDDLLSDWGFGLGCNGAVDVLLERIDPTDRPAYLQLVADAMARRQTVIVATVFARNGDVPVTVGTRTVLGGETEPSTPLPLFAAARQAMIGEQSQVTTVDFQHGTARVFCEKVSPPPHLLILGAGHDALPLARLAAQTGWDISVCDRRSAMATSQRFPQAMGVHAVPAEQSLAVLSHSPDAAVIMTHRYPEDIKLLRLLVDSSIRYIGVLGPRHRTDRMLRAAEIQLTAEVNERIHAPIGLDLGAETPEEIALAILAEATAVLRGYGGGKLRDKGRPIHEAKVQAIQSPKSEIRKKSQITSPNQGTIA